MLQILDKEPATAAKPAKGQAVECATREYDRSGDKHTLNIDFNESFACQGQV